jgi:hypothetical protein
MSPIPDWLWLTVAGAFPLLGGGLVWWQSKPREEENRLLALRASLRIQLRLRIADNISSELPVRRSREIDEAFLAQVKDAVVGYMDRQPLEMIDLKRCDDCCQKAIAANRRFKWLLLIFSLVGSGLLVWSRLTYESNDGSKGSFLLWSAIVVFIAIVVALIHREIKRDQFHDLCATYEIHDETEEE